MEKEFGKLSIQQLRAFYAAYYSTQEQQKEIAKEAALKEEKIQILLASVGAWGAGYEIPYLKILAMFLVVTGLWEELADAARADDPQQAVLDLIESSWEPEHLTEEEEKQSIGLFLVVLGNQNSLKMFNQPLSDLVAKAAEGDEEAALQAVTVDRAAVQAEPIARLICRAQLAGDESFMNRLARAITRTKPRRPREDLDDVRFLLEMLDEAKGLENIAHKALYDVLIDDLEVYPDTGKDAMSGLKKLIQKRKQQIGN